MGAKHWFTAPKLSWAAKRQLEPWSNNQCTGGKSLPVGPGVKSFIQISNGGKPDSRATPADLTQLPLKKKIRVGPAHKHFAQKKIFLQVDNGPIISYKRIKARDKNK